MHTDAMHSTAIIPLTSLQLLVSHQEFTNTFSEMPGLFLGSRRCQISEDAETEATRIHAVLTTGQTESIKI